jgi:hypothetical protein
VSAQAMLPSQVYDKDGSVHLTPACEHLGAQAFQLECLWDSDGMKADDALLFPGALNEVAEFLMDLADRAAEEMRAAL